MIEQVDLGIGTEVYMQIGGVGSGHDTYSHQVTECLHEHAGQADTGSMANKMADSQTAQTATEIL